MTEHVIAITRCVSWALMPHKCVSGRGFAPDPAGGAYSTPPDPYVDLRGPLCLLMLIKVLACFNLVLLIYLSYGP